MLDETDAVEKVSTPPKHSLALRLFHWLNGPLLFFMIVSGLMIYWAYPHYGLPGTWLEAIHLNQNLAKGLSLHLFFMWFFMLNGLCYFAHSLISGEWRELVPGRRSWRNAWFTLKHDLHLGAAPAPIGKFNGAQQISYTLVVLMGGASLVTGLAIYKPVTFSWLTWLLGGYSWARIEHFALMIGYLFFFVIHVAQVVRAGWPTLRAMITGEESGPRWRLLRSLTVGAVILFAGVWGYGKLVNATAEKQVPWPLRRAYAFNRKMSEVFYRESALSREFPLKDVEDLRTNGNIGMRSGPFDPATWRLQVEALDRTFSLSLDDIKKLPHHEVITELRCIEGWSRVVRWGGVRLSDFMAHYGLLPPGARAGGAKELFRSPFSIGMATPDGEYRVGIDLPSALHPQTLLAYELNGKPLSLEHGAPLRLAIPVKYGVKNIKRIGVIRVVRGPADDFWENYAYDWHLGF